MRLILLTGLYLEENISTIITNSKHGIENAANNLQWNIVDGVRSVLGNQKVEIVNFPYIGNYPRHYRKMWYVPSVNNTSFIQDNRFCNLIIYKKWDIYFRAYKSICESILRNGDDSVIVIYAINEAFIKAAVKAKIKYNNIKICLIVPDLLQGMIENLDWMHLLLLKRNIRVLRKQLPYIDKYVFLSEHMREFFEAQNGTYIVMEGIYNDKRESSITQIKTQYRDIVYTGNLAERYGILNLAKAFSRLAEKDLRLIICGIGGAYEELLRMSENDNRIILKGQLPHSEILNIQRNATLLVNPRTSDGEFTKFSFPSKTMEYLASGTPTLLYKLDGIPNEYYNYCFALGKWNGIDDLTQKIRAIINMPSEELKKIGMAARQFVLEKKNPIYQCSRMIEFLKT